MSRKHKKHKKQKKHGYSGNTSGPKTQILKNLASSGLWKGVRIGTRPPGMEKMSEVLLHFAAPLLNSAPNDAAYELALTFSIAVWNLSLIPPEGQAVQMQELIEATGKDDPGETRAIIEMLLQRKQTHFPENRRLIADYTLSCTGGQRHLTVASTEIEL
ncbi:MAG: hypothetical protein V1799_11185 [bacterium]